MVYDVFKVASGSYRLIVELKPPVELLTIKIRPVMLAVVHNQASHHEQVI